MSLDKNQTRQTESAAKRFGSVTQTQDRSNKKSVSDLRDQSTSRGSNVNVGADSSRWDYDLRMPEKPQGLERGLTLEKIVKAFKIKGETFLVTKWKNCSMLDIVPSSRLVELYPHVMIQYYEKLELRSIE